MRSVRLHWIRGTVILLTLVTCGGNPKDLTPGVIYETVMDGDVTYRVVRVDLTQAEVGLHWRAPDGAPIKSFERLRKLMKERSTPLVFAANAGIYEPDFTPTGLHIEDGKELVPLNRRKGEGNFYLKPNGVFFIGARGAAVLNAERFVDTTTGIRIATQSGPLLLENGQMHPQFVEGSTSLNTRSGVGVLSPTQIVFVLSKEPVTLHAFATFIRDTLACPDALYLDGAISQFYVPSVDWRIPKGAFAGFLTVTAHR